MKRLKKFFDTSLWLTVLVIAVRMSSFGERINQLKGKSKDQFILHLFCHNNITLLEDWWCVEKWLARVKQLLIFMITTFCNIQLFFCAISFITFLWWSDTLLSLENCSSNAFRYKQTRIKENKKYYFMNFYVLYFKSAS